MNDLAVNICPKLSQRSLEPSPKLHAGLFSSRHDVRNKCVAPESAKLGNALRQTMAPPDQLHRFFTQYLRAVLCATLHSLSVGHFK